MTDIHLEGKRVETGRSPEDSNHGDISKRAGGSTLKGQDGRDGGSHLSGSLTSWKSFFFYLCTEKLQFVKLGSPVPYVETDENKKNIPPRCSYKEIYSLAKKFEVEAVKNLVMNSLKSNLTYDNVEDELFQDLKFQEEEFTVILLDLLSYKKVDGECTEETVKRFCGVFDDHPEECTKIAALSITNNFVPPARCKFSACSFVYSHFAIDKGGSRCKGCKQFKARLSYDQYETEYNSRFNTRRR